MAYFSLTMNLTYRTTVTIEADSAEEADEKARLGELLDEGLSGAELIDWDKVGQVRCNA